MIESRDNGSLLRDDYRQQIWDLIHEINTDITVEVTYPTMDILGKQIFIASNIYGVSLVNDTNNIESFTTVILRYYMVYPETKPLLDWEAKTVRLLYDSDKYALLRCSAGSDNLVAKEVKEMGTKSAPYKRRESKPVEALLGGVTPLLAGVATVGLVSATGLAFQSIVVSTLFLTFAIYSVAASVICYLYQLILFPAILTLTAHKEYKAIDDGSKKACVWPEELPCIKKAGIFHDRAWKGSHCYWIVTYYGISIVETDLAVQTLAPPDARIVQFKVRYDEVIRGMQTAAIVVTTPGDLRDSKRFADVSNMIKDYETASYSYGPESTFCFLKPYMDFLMFREVEERPGTMRINETACALNEPLCLTSFLFTTGFTTLSSYREMFPLIQEWRAISNKYPDLGVYAYSERSTYADQTDALGDVIWQTLYSEVICMGISFIVFIPDVVSIVAAMYLDFSPSLWGVGINPVSMASLLMSIGFSVDISAHISYHYYQVKAPTPLEKLEDAFLNIGWPTMQGGLSTFFAMLPVLIKPSYLGMVFFKTVALVSIFGLIHGLIVLPVFLTMLTSLRRKCGRSTVAPADGDQSDSGSSTCTVPPHRISVKSFTVYKGHE
ncbi:patched family protein [Ostertagia ostertagi]